MDKIVLAISSYIKEKGISIVSISQKTGIPYSALQPSLSGKRTFKASEYLTVCQYLQEDPMKFYNQNQNQNQK